MSQKLILKFFYVYIILTTIVTTYFLISYKNNKEQYLNQKTEQHKLQYKAIYDKNRMFADLIFNTYINNNQIIEIFKNVNTLSIEEKNRSRNKLFDKLIQNYQKLKEYNVKQLHFHLPNNESFLRMHRPNKFGDDLTEVRESVRYVNKNIKKYDGFEEGRIFNGFRFVYPLFDNLTHIGSVEISFNVLSLIESIHNTYKLSSSFLIDKNVVDNKVFNEEKKNYIPSPNKEFYYEKNVHNKFPPMSIDENSKDMSNEIKQGIPFSIYIEKINLTKTFIPIKNNLTNSVVAALCICSEDKYIKNSKNSLITTLIMAYVLLAIVLFLFYIQKKANYELDKLNKDLDKKIALELKRNRKKDISILNSAKMVSIAEMLNNIAHQWRQPLNVISTSASGLKIHKEIDKLDDENFDILTNSILEQSKSLSKTIESFREYIHDNNEEKKLFILQTRVDKAIEIVNETFKYNQIEIIKKYEKDNIHIFANAGELIQVLLNILNNAKDVLIRNNSMDNRKIEIEIKRKNENIALISILDNAGGVPENIIDKIFDPYFTTKHESIGTGISLYICYELITVNFKGKIYIKNKKDGAKFYIEIPISK